MMVKPKYTGEQAVLEKIEELFEYRKLQELLRRGQLEKNKKFTGQLIRIQSHIYLLDAYLESQWELDKAELHRYWEGIRHALLELGYEEDQHEKLLRHIRRYEKIERKCRKDEWPTEVSMTRFYTTKSCDVQLIRHLIYEAAPVLKSMWKESGWIYYDLITEINDDINDVEEDMHTYNGNRFLISILRKGMTRTASKYKSFIVKVGQKTDAYFKSHPKQEQDHHLHDWITSRVQETLSLLEQSVENLDMEHLSTAYVLQHMK